MDSPLKSLGWLLNLERVLAKYNKIAVERDTNEYMWLQQLLNPCPLYVVGMCGRFHGSRLHSETCEHNWSLQVSGKLNAAALLTLHA